MDIKGSYIYFLLCSKRYFSDSLRLIKHTQLVFICAQPFKGASLTTLNTPWSPLTISSLHGLDIAIWSSIGPVLLLSVPCGSLLCQTVSFLPNWMTFSIFLTSGLGAKRGLCRDAAVWLTDWFCLGTLTGSSLHSPKCLLVHRCAKLLPSFAQNEAFPLWETYQDFSPKNSSPWAESCLPFWTLQFLKLQNLKTKETTERIQLFALFCLFLLLW